MSYLVGIPVDITKVDDIDGSHFVNMENNNDYFIINLDNNEFFNPAIGDWQALNNTCTPKEKADTL